MLSIQEWIVLKIIEEDNLGDTNRLYLTLHEVGSLHS